MLIAPIFVKGKPRNKSLVVIFQFLLLFSLLGIGGCKGQSELWVNDIHLLQTLQGDAADIVRVVFSPDGTLLASASSDSIQLWRVEDGTLLYTLEGNTEVAFSPDGAFLFSGAYESNVRLWRVQDGTLLDEIPGGVFALCGLDLSPNGVFLAVSLYDNSSQSNEGFLGVVRVAESSFSEQPIIILSEPGGEAACGVQFSPNGELLAVGNLRSISLVQVSDWSEQIEIQDAEIPIAFSPDNELLVGILQSQDNSEETTIALWRVSDGRLQRKLETKAKDVYQLAFSPDGALLTMPVCTEIVWKGNRGSCRYGNIQIWRVSNGRQLRVIEGDADTDFGGIAFSPDGTLLASGSEDGTIWLWGVEE